MLSKDQVFQEFISIASGKINMLEEQLMELNNALTSDTKSSAGDKHETSRAMTQLEIEKIQHALHQALQARAYLQSINLTNSNKKIVIGSLIETNKDFFFISAGLGKLTINNYTIIAISAASPIGKKLIGLEINDELNFNDVTYKIKSIS